MKKFLTAGMITATLLTTMSFTAFAATVTPASTECPYYEWCTAADHDHENHPHYGYNEYGGQGHHNGGHGGHGRGHGTGGMRLRDGSCYN